MRRIFLYILEFCYDFNFNVYIEENGVCDEKYYMNLKLILNVYKVYL